VIANPFQMNDWKNKKFVSVVLIVQLTMLGLVGLGALGFDIPVLRQIVGFVYLTFLPGIIILRLLKLHELGPVRTLLYSVGLSLAFNMFLGFLINMLYPHIGISRPISTLPLVATWTLVLCLLCFIVYKTDNGFFIPTHFKVGGLFSPPVLFLILLPLLAVVGTQLVRSYQTNIVLMILIGLIGLVPILAMFARFIPERLYPLAIYGTALALLWHLSLVFTYLAQWDSFLEYHFSARVTESGFWNSDVPHEYNAMLSITILPATVSQLLNISGTALYKLIYPLWYALVPLGLYEVYRSRLDNRLAFLAVFLFVSIDVFFLHLPFIGRMMVAELFCVLLVMLVIDREVTSSKRALLILFGASLVVSHYSLSYLYIAFFVFSLIVLHLLREKTVRMTTYSVMSFIVIGLAWYMYMSGSAPLDAAAHIGKHLYESLSLELLNPFSRDAVQVLMGISPDVLHWTYRILWYLVLFFMAVGATALLSDLRRREANKEYATLAIGNYILLGACITIPFFSNTLGVTRMVHIASLILAPFCILGAEIVFRGLSRAIQFIRRSIPSPTKPTAAVTAILVLFFLFNTTLPFEIADSPVGRSMPLEYGHITSGEKSIELGDRIDFWQKRLAEQEVSSAEWLAKHRSEERRIHATYVQIGVPVLLSYGMIPEEQTRNLTPLTTMKDIESSYVYLGYVNMVIEYGTTGAHLGRPDPVLGDIMH